MDSNFADEMHELAAKATGHDESRVTAGLSVLISAVHGLNQRFESLEELVLQRFDGLRFPKLEEQVAAIRNSETVNQKLFDSLHEELINYRDNFVRDALQKPFIRDLLALYDDLSALVRQCGAGESAPNESQPSEQLCRNLENARHFLLEILHRLEVSEIEPRERVDRSIHKVINFEPTDDATETDLIVRRTKTGFIWHDRVLRPEEVVAKRVR